MAKMNTTEFLVIGTGVIGSSIAYHLAARGAQVVLLGPPIDAPAASWASAGGVRRQNRDKREWLLAAAASHRWPSLADELGSDCGFEAHGHLHVAESPDGLRVLAARVAAEQGAGLEAVLLDSQEARSAAPLLAPTVLGASYTPGDGQADPRQTTAAFQQAFSRLGGKWLHAAADELCLKSGRVSATATSAGVLSAGMTVVAAGSWTNHLLSTVGTEIPTTPIALQMLRTDPAGLIRGPTITSEERLLSFKQLRDGRFFIGGGWQGVVSPDLKACEPLPSSIEASWRTASTLVPALGERVIAEAFCGIESISNDQVPVIGALPYPDSLYVASAFSGHGFQLSPAVGEAVARELLGGLSPELDDLRPVRPQRGANPQAP
jgi:sarcosine oxidase subunit beta